MHETRQGLRRPIYLVLEDLPRILSLTFVLLHPSEAWPFISVTLILNASHTHISSHSFLLRSPGAPQLTL